MGLPVPSLVQHWAGARQRSILDIPRRLTAVLLGVPFVLTALRIALLVRGPALLLRVAGTLARFLTNVTPGATLLSLFGCQGGSRGSHQSQSNGRGRELPAPCKHGVLRNGLRIDISCRSRAVAACTPLAPA